MIYNGVTLSNDEEIAETFNKYFCNIAKMLSLPENPSIKEPAVELFTDPVNLALEKYKDHLSIRSIKNKMTSLNNPKFSFRLASLNETLDGVNKVKKKPHKLLVNRSKLLKKAKMLYHFTFFIISTMHYQVALFELH